MSYLLTEKKNYQNYQSILEKRQKINEIKNNELNKECFDCGACYPEYISINNGVFICNNCLEIHNTFPKEISSTLKNNLSSLNNKELQYMYLGGNQRLFEFIHYEFPELSKFKKNILYRTKAMQYYRDKLNYLINSGPEPMRPSKEINAYELIDVFNERNNKKYERINLDGNKNKGIYKTEKRNKSVGNKNGKENKNLIYNNNTKKIRKSSINKSFRKNHFLDEDNVEVKRHKSFYKEMNKLFKDEDETPKKEYNYYRKNQNNLISNNINDNNIKLKNMNFDKYIKYNSKTNNKKDLNKINKYPIENIYNNNFYNLSTTKNIFMFTPIKDELIYDYTQMNNNDINSLDKFSLTNNRDIYLKPKTSSLINTSRNDQDNNLNLPLKKNINRINLIKNYNYRKDNASLKSANLYELKTEYPSTNTYKRKNSQKKTKELFANMNINKKNNVQNNNLMKYVKRIEPNKKIKDENNEKNNYTVLDNNKIQIKEIKIENIRRKMSANIFNDETLVNKNNNTNIIDRYKNLNTQVYKKLNIKDINNKNNLNNAENGNNKSKGKTIKNINIFFDKNKISKYENPFVNISFNKPEENIGNSLNQKYSIRNKYKMKRKIGNII